MAEPQAGWPVSVLGEGLAGSRRGFSDDRPRHATSSVDAEQVALVARVTALAVPTRHRDGSRRMTTHLQEEGGHVGRAKAQRLMQEAGGTVQRPTRRGSMTTDNRHGYAVAPNLLARQCDVSAPDQVWAGDIPSIWTAEGWWYLAVLLDVYARKGVGWSMRSPSETTWVQDALQRALGRRHPAAGFWHHSDRGSQAARHADQAWLTACGIGGSMSAKGECLDHAVAERFFGRLKHAWTSHGHDAPRQEARDDSVAYIEVFDNSNRKHAYLGDVRPNDYEKSALVA